MINKVTLLGYLGKDPEIKTLENGAMYARFSVATTENYKDREGNWKENTEWHNIIAWRSLAERAERSLQKGTLIYLEGKLSTRKWTDQEGKDRYTTEIVAERLRIVKRSEEGSTGGGSQMSTPSAPMDNPSEKIAELEDDLPF